VIFNLAMNAIEAMRGGTTNDAVRDAVPGAARPRQLCIRTVRKERGGAMVAVEDSGPGILAVDPEQLFAAFYTTKEEGFGIGLSISRTIIEAHGGRLWATNSASGAVFQFELPIIA
jgi:signal transduction histidine kinase